MAHGAGGERAVVGRAPAPARRGTVAAAGLLGRRRILSSRGTQPNSNDAAGDTAARLAWAPRGAYGAAARDDPVWHRSRRAAAGLEPSKRAPAGAAALEIESRGGARSLAATRQFLQLFRC